MTTHRLTNWTLASLLAALLCAGSLLDSDDLASVGQSDAQRQAQREARRERAAIEVCTRAYGLGASATWDDDGQLVCKPRKGRDKGMRVEV